MLSYPSGTGTTSSLVALLAGLLVLYLVVSTTTAWYRLRHIPGPFLASFSYLTVLRIGLGSEHGARYREVNDKYGPLARIGPRDLITDDPDIIKHMNSARSRYVRSNHYLMGRFQPDHDSMFTLLNTKAHDERKSQTAAGYSGRENSGLEADIDLEISQLISLIRKKCISTDSSFRPMDLAITSLYLTLDIIGKIAYGRDFGHLTSDSDVYGYIAFLHKTMTTFAFSILGEIPWLTGFLFTNTVLRAVAPRPSESGLGKILKIAKELVGERFGPDAKEKRDMLGSFVRHGMTQEQCEAEILFQIAAGSDTTANVMRGTMLNLMTAPDIYSKLQKEIDAAMADGRVSTPVKLHEAQQLEYLQAVIYEGLRIVSPTSALFLKEVPPEGDTINGQFLPGGTRIAVNSLGIRRLKTVFGQDVDLFRPERWLAASPEKRRQMAQTVDLVFGYGRWGCSGKQVALLTLNKVFVELFRNFKFQLANPIKPVTVLDHAGIIYDDMWVRVTQRTAA